MTAETPNRTPGGDRMPERVGPYRILDLVGEGGMGVVYAGEQTQPVRRRVAVKMMKPGLDSEEIASRFEAERHALAVMDHPGIARVLDTGVADDGRPWFAMEFVSGIRIDEYCDRFRLTVRERIELVAALCEAIQHAHQKGVIHRDLKPSNVLVTEVDGRPVPKVIDFGIAKATGLQLHDSPYITSLGHAVGTLAYMSPEQAEGSGLDVDTRADVYSLGVILYQLVTGAVPIDPREVGGARFLARLIQHDEAFPDPATRLRADTATGSRAAQARGTNDAGLLKLLSGDLRWIVMRAIEKDRNRRYDTANGLRLDLLRFLSDEPVLARPPSTAYRMRKFVRRHRAAVFAAGAAGVILFAGVISTTLGLRRAQRAEAEARAAEEVARIEAESARSVSEFLRGLFDVSRPGEEGGATTARDLLARGAERIDRDLAGQPLVQARMLTIIGGVYRSLGLLDDSHRLLGRAVALYDETDGSPDADVAAALREFGVTLRQRGDLDRAEESLLRSLALYEALDPDPSGDAGESHRVAGTLSSLGGVYLTQGRLDEAEEALGRALALEEESLDGDDRETATIVSDLGALALYRGEFLRAEQYFRRSIQLRERELGASHPDLAASWNNLGAALFYQEMYAEAGDAYEHAGEIWRRTLDPDHPQMASVANNLGEVRWRLGDFAAAEELFLDALRIKERTLTPDNPSNATTLLGLANVYRDQGRFAEAEPRYLRAIQILEMAVGQTSSRLSEPLGWYAEMLRAAGRPDEAARVEDRLSGLTG